MNKIKSMTKKQKAILIGVITGVLLLLLGSTYAYFSVNSSSDDTSAKIKGKAANNGNASLRTETSMLYLNLDANLMSKDNINKTYFANKDSSGKALETNPNYILATASLANGDAPLNCEYNYKVTATVTKTITDNSDNDVTVTIGDKTLTLKEILASSTTGIIVNGKINNLTTGTDQTIKLSSSVTNTSSTQDNLTGNSYTIKIEPYTSGDTKAFSCKLASSSSDSNSFANQLINSGDLWQSGLDGDGYRYVGSGSVGSTTNPNNFICFGATDKTECTANQDKYMYRVIGVFTDSNEDNHVKLIKYKQLISTTWNSTSADVNWEDSTLYTSLNGSGFLTNTTYDYLQNNTWSNRIENWTWSAVNTKTYEDQTNNPNYQYSNTKGIYLNEMHRTSSETLCKNNGRTAINCNGGSWTTPIAKIGLMYVSDVALSLGASVLSSTGADSALARGWMHQGNNDTTKTQYEWTMSRIGNNSSYDVYNVWYSDSSRGVTISDVDGFGGVRPVFYLTSDQESSGGTGSIDDPFILK